MPFAFAPVGIHAPTRGLTRRASVSDLPSRAERDALLKELVLRAADRAARIAADTAAKEAIWAAELASLRTSAENKSPIELHTPQKSFRDRCSMYSRFAEAEPVVRQTFSGRGRVLEKDAVSSMAATGNPLLGEQLVQLDAQSNEMESIPAENPPIEVQAPSKSFLDRAATYAKFAQVEPVAQQTFTGFVQVKEKVENIEGTVQAVGGRIKDAVVGPDLALATASGGDAGAEAVKGGPAKLTLDEITPPKERKSFGASLLDAGILEVHDTNAE